MNELNIGNTPMIQLTQPRRHGLLTIKAEYLNPYGSVKDRTAAYLIAWAIASHGRTVRLVESTSGNLGIALSHICSRLGLRSPLLVVDPSIPENKLNAIEDAGGELVVVSKPAKGLDLRQTRISVARELGAKRHGLWINQYDNDAGMRAHAETTGPEITLAEPDVDFIVAPISTGGTACGIGQHIKTSKHKSRIVAVEPLGSTIFGGPPRPFVTAGAGMAGPSGLTKRHLACIHGYAKVSDRTAAQSCRSAISQLGVLVGLTTGAAIAAAERIARDHLNVTVIAPDLGDHYRAYIDRAPVGATPIGEPPTVLRIIK